MDRLSKNHFKIIKNNLLINPAQQKILIMEPINLIYKLKRSSKDNH
jgi:hypothetical protein